jgi:hypothetical protein
MKKDKKIEKDQKKVLLNKKGIYKFSNPEKVE